MPTLGERVEAYAGSQSDPTLLSSWLSAGLRQIVDLIPDTKLRAHTRRVSVDTTTGLGLGEYRIASLMRNGRGARPLPIELATQAQDSTSLYYASDTDPIYYFSDEKAYGYPTTGTWVAEVIPYQDVNFGDERILSFPVEYENLVVLSAAIQAVIARMEEERDSLPDPVDAPSFTYDDLDFSIDLTTEWAKFHEYLHTNEDIELAQEKLNEINTKLESIRLNRSNQFNLDAQLWSAKLQKYVAEVGAGVQKMQFISGQLAALQSQYQQALQLAFGGKA